MKPLVLVGFMCAGKTTVGRLSAERLAIPFVDTDEEIERLHAPIEELFASRGEREFRRIEREVVDAALRRDGVVALGGGAFAQPGAADEILARGRVAWLRVSPERVLQRAGDRVRPLLGPAPARERVEELLAQREPLYARAHLTVDADDDAERIAARLVAWYAGEGER
ncbi:MAG TPA: shikimate kinase [Candidatus Dormibacteraeota bacterium]|nr:shikimate kinase [Candidatus Dormibacteraeota bacterium]